MAVAKSLRFTVLERDGFTCQYCGAKAPGADLQVDHIIPESGGGGDGQDNLITACKDCNSGKGARELRGQVSNEDVRVKLEALTERRALLQECADVRDDIIRLRDDDMWTLAIRWMKVRGGKLKADGTWNAPWELVCHLRSLLGQHEYAVVLECVDITLASKPDASDSTCIRYLYGVVRNHSSLMGVTP